MADMTREQAVACPHMHRVVVDRPSAATSSGIGCLATGGRCNPGTTKDCPTTPAVGGEDFVKLCHDGQPCEKFYGKGAEQPADKGECKTCGGRGEVGGHVGQTPESSEWRSEPCPDCHPNGRDMTEIDAAIAAMKDKPGEKVRGLVGKWREKGSIDYDLHWPELSAERYILRGYAKAKREDADELEAALSAKGENEDTTHER